MRLIAAAGLALLAACATPAPQEPASFTAAPGEVMLFAPTRAVTGEGRGYTSLSYLGMLSESQAVFDVAPLPRPPLETVPTGAPGVLAPAGRAEAPSPRGFITTDDLPAGEFEMVLDPRQGAIIGVESVSVVILSAEPGLVRYRVEVADQ